MESQWKEILSVGPMPINRQQTQIKLNVITGGPLCHNVVFEHVISEIFFFILQVLCVNTMAFLFFYKIFYLCECVCVSMSIYGSCAFSLTLSSSVYLVLFFLNYYIAFY